MTHPELTLSSFFGHATLRHVGEEQARLHHNLDIGAGVPCGVNGKCFASLLLNVDLTHASTTLCT